MRTFKGRAVMNRQAAAAALGVSYERVRVLERHRLLQIATRGPDGAIYYWEWSVDVAARAVRAKAARRNPEGSREARLLERFEAGQSDVQVAIELKECLDHVRAVRARYHNADLIVLPAHVAELRALGLRLGVKLHGAADLVAFVAILVEQAEQAETSYPARAAQEGNNP